MLVYYAGESNHDQMRIFTYDKAYDIKYEEN